MQRRQVAGWAQAEGVMAGWQPKVDSANGDFESLPEVAKSDMQVESRFLTDQDHCPSVCEECLV
jgi:hypothetical protein